MHFERVFKYHEYCASFMTFMNLSSINTVWLKKFTMRISLSSLHFAMFAWYQTINVALATCRWCELLGYTNSLFQCAAFEASYNQPATSFPGSLFSASLGIYLIAVCLSDPPQTFGNSLRVVFTKIEIFSATAKGCLLGFGRLGQNLTGLGGLTTSKV